MVPTEFPEYTTKEIERRAANLLKAKCGQNPHPPIDLELLLESMPGVRLDIITNLRLRHNVEGCVCKELESGLIYVYVDAEIARNEFHYRTVIGEELGHIQLHAKLIESLQCVDDFLDIQHHCDWMIAERDARSFGRAIAMPFPALVKEAEAIYESLVDVAGFGDRNAIEKYLRNGLADTFGVRPDDIQRRLVRPPSNILERVALSIRKCSSELLPIVLEALPDATHGQKRLWQEETFIT